MPPISSTGTGVSVPVRADTRQADISVSKLSSRLRNLSVLGRVNIGVKANTSALDSMQTKMAGTKKAATGISTALSRVNTGNLNRSLSTTQRQFTNVNKSASKTGEAVNRTTRNVGGLNRSLKETSRSTSNISRMMGNWNKALIGTAAAYAVLRQVQFLNKSWDQITGAENKLALVTGKTKELSEATSELFQISKRTGVVYTANAEIFNRFGRALEGNIGMDELLEVSETVSKAVSISGSPAESANMAIIQLGQGLAAGALRGQELNSVLEQTPRIAMAIADHLGVGIGQLRKIAENNRQAVGGLTTEVILEALRSQKNKIDDEFDSIEILISGRSAVMWESFSRAIKKVMDDLGIASQARRTMVNLTNLFNDFAESTESLTYDKLVGDFFGKLVPAFSIVANSLYGVYKVLVLIIDRYLYLMPKFKLAYITILTELEAAGKATITAITSSFERGFIRFMAADPFPSYAARTALAFAQLVKSTSADEFSTNMGVFLKEFENVGRGVEYWDVALRRSLNRAIHYLDYWGIRLRIVDNRFFRFRTNFIDNARYLLSPIEWTIKALEWGFVELAVLIRHKQALLAAIIWEYIKASAVYDLYADTLKPAVDSIAESFDKLKESITSTAIWQDAVAGIKWVYDTIVELLDTLYNFLSKDHTAGFFGGIRDSIGGLFNQSLDFDTAPIRKVFEILVKTVSMSINLGKYLSVEYILPFYEKVKAIVGSTLQFITKATTSIISVVDRIYVFIKNVSIELKAAFGDRIVASFKRVYEATSDFVQNTYGTLKDLFTNRVVKFDFELAVDNVVQFFDKVESDVMKLFAKTGEDVVQEFETSFVPAIYNFATKVIDKIKSIFNAIHSFVKAAIDPLRNEEVEEVRTLPFKFEFENITQFLNKFKRDASDEFEEAGKESSKSFSAKFITGFKNLVTNIVTWVNYKFESIGDKIKSSFISLTDKIIERNNLEGIDDKFAQAGEDAGYSFIDMFLDPVKSGIEYLLLWIRSRIERSKVELISVDSSQVDENIEEFEESGRNAAERFFDGFYRHLSSLSDRIKTSAIFGDPELFKNSLTPTDDEGEVEGFFARYNRQVKEFYAGIINSDTELERAVGTQSFFEKQVEAIKNYTYKVKDFFKTIIDTFKKSNEEMATSSVEMESRFDKVFNRFNKIRKDQQQAIGGFFRGDGTAEEGATAGGGGGAVATITEKSKDFLPDSTADKFAEVLHKAGDEFRKKLQSTYEVLLYSTVVSSVELIKLLLHGELISLKLKDTLFRYFVEPLNILYYLTKILGDIRASELIETLLRDFGAIIGKHIREIIISFHEFWATILKLSKDFSQSILEQFGFLGRAISAILDIPFLSFLAIPTAVAFINILFLRWKAFGILIGTLVGTFKLFRAVYVSAAAGMGFSMAGILSGKEKQGDTKAGDIFGDFDKKFKAGPGKIFTALARMPWLAPVTAGLLGLMALMGGVGTVAGHMGILLLSAIPLFPFRKFAEVLGLASKNTTAAGAAAATSAPFIERLGKFMILAAGGGLLFFQRFGVAVVTALKSISKFRIALFAAVAIISTVGLATAASASGIAVSMATILFSVENLMPVIKVLGFALGGVIVYLKILKPLFFASVAGISSFGQSVVKSRFGLGLLLSGLIKLSFLLNRFTIAGAIISLASMKFGMEGLYYSVIGLVAYFGIFHGVLLKMGNPFSSFKSNVASVATKTTMMGVAWSSVGVVLKTVWSVISRFAIAFFATRKALVTVAAALGTMSAALIFGGDSFMYLAAGAKAAFYAISTIVIAVAALNPVMSILAGRALTTKQTFAQLLVVLKSTGKFLTQAAIAITLFSTRLSKLLGLLLLGKMSVKNFALAFVALRSAGGLGLGGLLTMFTAGIGKLTGVVNKGATRMGSSFSKTFPRTIRGSGLFGKFAGLLTDMMLFASIGMTKGFFKFGKNIVGGIGKGIRAAPNALISGSLFKKFEQTKIGKLVVDGILRVMGSISPQMLKFFARFAAGAGLIFAIFEGPGLMGKIYNWLFGKKDFVTDRLKQIRAEMKELKEEANKLFKSDDFEAVSQSDTFKKSGLADIPDFVANIDPNLYSQEGIRQLNLAFGKLEKEVKSNAKSMSEHGRVSRFAQYQQKKAVDQFQKAVERYELGLTSENVSDKLAHSIAVAMSKGGFSDTEIQNELGVRRTYRYDNFDFIEEWKPLEDLSRFERAVSNISDLGEVTGEGFKIVIDQTKIWVRSFLYTLRHFASQLGPAFNFFLNPMHAMLSAVVDLGRNIPGVSQFIASMQSVGDTIGKGLVKVWDALNPKRTVLTQEQIDVATERTVKDLTSRQERGATAGRYEDMSREEMEAEIRKGHDEYNKGAIEHNEKKLAKQQARIQRQIDEAAGLIEKSTIFTIISNHVSWVFDKIGGFFGGIADAIVGGVTDLTWSIQSYGIELVESMDFLPGQVGILNIIDPVRRSNMKVAEIIAAKTDADYKALAVEQNIRTERAVELLRDSLINAQQRFGEDLAPFLIPPGLDKDIASMYLDSINNIDPFWVQAPLAPDAVRDSFLRGPMRDTALWNVFDWGTMFDLSSWGKWNKDDLNIGSPDKIMQDREAIVKYLRDNSEELLAAELESMEFLATSSASWSDNQREQFYTFLDNLKGKLDTTGIDTKLEAQIRQAQKILEKNVGFLGRFVDTINRLAEMGMTSLGVEIDKLKKMSVGERDHTLGAANIFADLAENAFAYYREFGRSQSEKDLDGGFGSVDDLINLETGNQLLDLTDFDVDMANMLSRVRGTEGADGSFTGGGLENLQSLDEMINDRLGSYGIEHKFTQLTIEGYNKAVTIARGLKTIDLQLVSPYLSPADRQALEEIRRNLIHGLTKLEKDLNTFLKNEFNLEFPFPELVTSKTRARITELKEVYQNLPVPDIDDHELFKQESADRNLLRADIEFNTLGAKGFYDSLKSLVDIPIDPISFESFLTFNPDRFKQLTADVYTAQDSLNHALANGLKRATDTAVIELDGASRKLAKAMSGVFTSFQHEKFSDFLPKLQDIADVTPEMYRNMSLNQQEDTHYQTKQIMSSDIDLDSMRLNDSDAYSAELKRRDKIQRDIQQRAFDSAKSMQAKMDSLKIMGTDLDLGQAISLGDDFDDFFKLNRELFQAQGLLDEIGKLTGENTSEWMDQAVVVDELQKLVGEYFDKVKDGTSDLKKAFDSIGLENFSRMTRSQIQEFTRLQIVADGLDKSIDAALGAGNIDLAMAYADSLIDVNTQMSGLTDTATDLQKAFNEMGKGLVCWCISW